MSTAAQPPTPASPTISGLILTYLIIDVLFGIIVPILCLVFDPFVFRTNGALSYLGGFFAQYRVFAYTSIGLGILTLGVWLAVGQRLRPWHGFFAGVFLVGAVFALAIGLALLPASVLGLMFIVGGLGFLPFFASFVYARDARRALATLRAPQAPASQGASLSFMALGWVVVLALPALAQWQTSQMVAQNVQTLITGDAPAIQQSVQTLKYAFWCDMGCYDKIIGAYQAEDDPARRALLAAAYLELTQQPIEFVIARNAD